MRIEEQPEVLCPWIVVDCIDTCRLTFQWPY